MLSRLMNFQLGIAKIMLKNLFYLIIVRRKSGDIALIV
jgi:hypothetical protein